MNALSSQVLEKGMPEDAMPGIKDKQVPLPDDCKAIPGLFNSQGVKVTSCEGFTLVHGQSVYAQPTNRWFMSQVRLTSAVLPPSGAPHLQGGAEPALDCVGRDHTKR